MKTTILLSPLLFGLLLGACRRDDPADPIGSDRPELIGTWAGGSDEAGASVILTVNFAHDIAAPDFEGNGVLSWSFGADAAGSRVLTLRGVIAGTHVAFTTERNVAGHDGRLLADYFSGSVIHPDTLRGSFDILLAVDCAAACEHHYANTAVTLARQQPQP
jgi:hypothetical protein